MTIPVVSPTNWERTRGICHFAMGTPLDAVDELAFRHQVEVIIDDADGYVEAAEENEEVNNDSSTTYRTHSEFDGSPDEPYRYIAITDRETDHRPYVSEESVDALKETVKDERPSVPAERFDFDRNLSILLDAAERYYNSLQCEIIT